jgi:hypothetical protein
MHPSFLVMRLLPLFLCALLAAGLTAASDTPDALVMLNRPTDGGIYHRPGCSSLTDSTETIFLKRAQERKLQPHACMTESPSAAARPVSAPAPPRLDGDALLARLGTCRGMSDNFARLACYDELGAATAPTTSGVQPVAAVPTVAAPTASPTYAAPAARSSSSPKKCWVNGYTRKNGTKVAGYYRDCN